MKDVAKLCVAASDRTSEVGGVSHAYPKAPMTPDPAAGKSAVVDRLRDAFKLPWPSVRNPRSAEHELAMRSEAVELGLLSSDPTERNHRRFASFVLLDGFVYPQATLAGLEQAGAYNQWLHFLDDQYDDHEQLGQDPQAVCAIMERALQILESGELPQDPTPFDRLTLRLQQRLARRAPAGWMHRFLEDVRDYLLRGSLIALQRWTAARVPTVDEYLPIRLLDSAVLTVFDLMELIGEVQLHPGLFYHRHVRTLRMAAAYHIIFVNDLVSYHKEVVERRGVCNLVYVLQKEERIPLDEALRRVKQRADDELARFLAAEAALQDEVPQAPDLVRYIDGLKAWISGNVDFSIRSSRFRWPLEDSGDLLIG